MLDVHRGDVDALMITSLDRLGLTIRRSVLLLADLAARGIHLVSLSERFSSTSEEGLAALEFIVALVAADQRGAKERGKAAIDEARRRGSRIGRPRAVVDVGRAVELRGQGKSFRQVASALGVGVATVHRALVAAGI